ncbi:MAG: TonB-dependent receptor plug domain-containing protein, partial [Pseudomonadota bacterium]
MKGSWPLGKPRYLGWTVLAVAAAALAQEPEQRAVQQAAPHAASQAAPQAAQETALRTEQRGAPPTKPGVASAAALELDPATAVVVVDGKCASLAAAQRIKRNQLAVVDSVVAEQVQTLPDFSVTDALQRITGVQIARDRGEGANVAIRGLTQMETTINGREVFTAGTGRNLDFADYPAEMVAGIDVYKSSSADQLDGGIGGVIDLRTRR